MNSLSSSISEVKYMISDYCSDTQFEYKNEILDVISAAELQIPRKPLGTHYAHMRCPSCNHRIPSGMGSSSHRRDNWCNHCGQKIDWEVSDNG